MKKKELSPELFARQTARWGGVGVVASLSGLLLVAATGDSLRQMEIRSASALVSLVAVLVYFLLCRQSVLGAWSTLSLAFLILSLFHAGLFLEIAMSGDLRETFQYHQEWMVSGTAQSVVIIVIVAFLSFLLGASLPIAFRRESTKLNRQELGSNASLTRELDDSEYRMVTARFGALLLTVGVIFWFYENISQDGWLFFTLGYRNFFSSSRDLDTSVTVLPILLGVGFVAQCTKLFSSRVALALFIVYSLVSMIVGARIYPMSGLVIFLIILGLRRRMPRSRWLFGGVILALAIVSVIRSFRNDGLVAVQRTPLLLDPGGSLAELGSTVKVVAVSYRWHEGAQEPFAMGLTFINPLVRGFNSLFGLPNIPGDVDPGSFVNVIAGREGQIGGSIVAEAHHNWALPGVLVVLALWAAALSIASSASKSSLAMSITALLLVLFLIQVRGFFGPIPALSIIGALLIVTSRALTRIWRGTVSPLHGPKLVSGHGPRR